MRSRLVFLALAFGPSRTWPRPRALPRARFPGRVTSGDGLSIPGVTVTATSPALQGERVAVTTANGDYLLAFLPPGEYGVSFVLDGFKTVQQRATIAAAQVFAINPTLQVAGLTETVQVVGAVSETMNRTATAATTLKQDTVNDLPLNRGIDATVALTPGAVRGAVHRQRRAGALDLWREFLRDPRPVERRGDPGQPAADHRRFVVHRGRHPGNHGVDVLCLCGVRSFQRWRGQRDHEVGQQPPRRHVPGWRSRTTTGGR